MRRLKATGFPLKNLWKRDKVPLSPGRHDELPCPRGAIDLTEILWQIHPYDYKHLPKKPRNPWYCFKHCRLFLFIVFFKMLTELIMRVSDDVFKCWEICRYLMLLRNMTNARNTWLKCVLTTCSALLHTAGWTIVNSGKAVNIGVE